MKYSPLLVWSDDIKQHYTGRWQCGTSQFPWIWKGGDCRWDYPVCGQGGGSPRRRRRRLLALLVIVCLWAATCPPPLLLLVSVCLWGDHPPPPPPFPHFVWLAAAPARHCWSQKGRRKPGPCGWKGVAEPRGALGHQVEREREKDEDYFTGRVAQYNQTMTSFIPEREIHHLSKVTAWQNDCWHESKIQYGSLMTLLAFTSPWVTILEDVSNS